VLTQPSQDAGALRACCEEPQTGDSHGNFGELARSLRSLAESIPTPIELHLFSGHAKSELPASFSELRCRRISPLVFIRGQSAVPELDGGKREWCRARFWDRKKRACSRSRGFNTPAATRQSSLLVNGQTLATQMSPCCQGARHHCVSVRSMSRYGLRAVEVRIDSADEFSGGRHEPLSPVERTDPGAHYSCMKPATRGSPVISERPWHRPRSCVHRRYRQRHPGLPASSLEYALACFLTDFGAPPPFESGSAEIYRPAASVWVAAGTFARISTASPYWRDILSPGNYSPRATASCPRGGRRSFIPL